MDDFGLTVVVTAGQGCAFAQGVLDAVRAQLGVGDELLVMEPAPCGRSSPSAVERHVCVDSSDEFHMRVLGIAESSRTRLLVLEDHAIPSPDFLTGLRGLLDASPALEAVTFFMANGTHESASSRALFIYVLGDAMPDHGRPLPATVASSFALAGATFERTRVQARAGNLAPGVVEYEVVPGANHRGLEALPVGLVLTHHQRTTLVEALSANYWNARVLGARERSLVTAGHAVPMTSRRYLWRVASLLRRRPDARRVPFHLGLVGTAAFSGWWVGRWTGTGHSAERLSRSHRQPDPPA